MNDYQKYVKSYNIKVYVVLIIAIIMYLIIIVDSSNLISGFDLGIKLNDGMFYLLWPLLEFFLGWVIIAQSYHSKLEKLINNQAMDGEQKEWRENILPEWFDEYHPHAIVKTITHHESIYFTKSITNGKFTFTRLYFLQNTIAKPKVPLQGLAVRQAKHVINEVLDLEGMARLRGGEITTGDIDIDSPAIIIELNQNALPATPVVFVANRKKLKDMTLANTITEEVSYNQEFIGYVCYDPETESNAQHLKMFILNNIQLFNQDAVVLCAKDNLLVYANRQLPTSIQSDPKTKRKFFHLYLSEQTIIDDIDRLANQNKQVIDTANLLQTINL